MIISSLIISIISLLKTWDYKTTFFYRCTSYKNTHQIVTPVANFRRNRKWEKLPNRNILPIPKSEKKRFFLVDVLFPSENLRLWLWKWNQVLGSNTLNSDYLILDGNSKDYFWDLLQIVIFHDFRWPFVCCVLSCESDHFCRKWVHGELEVFWTCANVRGWKGMICGHMVL